MTSLSVHYILQSSSQRSQGRPVAALNDFIHAEKLLALALPVGIFSGLCSRVSICLFLLRIFRSVKAWRVGLYLIMAYATIVVIPTFIILLAHCQPIQKQWDPHSPGTCWPPVILSRTSYAYGGKYQYPLNSFTLDFSAKASPSAASVTCDWILATLPIVFLWNLQMKVRVKMGICALMGMGYLYDPLRGPSILHC